MGSCTHFLSLKDIPFWFLWTRPSTLWRPASFRWVKASIEIVRPLARHPHGHDRMRRTSNSSERPWVFAAEVSRLFRVLAKWWQSSQRVCLDFNLVRLVMTRAWCACSKEDWEPGGHQQHWWDHWRHWWCHGCPLGSQFWQHIFCLTLQAQGQYQYHFEYWKSHALIDLTTYCTNPLESCCWIDVCSLCDFIFNSSTFWHCLRDIFCSWAKDRDLLSPASINQVVIWAWRLTLKRLVWCSALAVYACNGLDLLFERYKATSSFWN